MANCAKCPYPNKRCQDPEGQGLPDCPTLVEKDAVDVGFAAYSQEPERSLARVAAAQEASGYCLDRDGEAFPTKTRLQETLEFLARMGYKRIGLAFCVGLIKEAGVVAGMLEEHGFEVVSAACKAGCFPKESLGLGPEDRIRPDGVEALCNPAGQAEICNRAETEFNVVMGLCVGHDALFLRHSEAYCTVFAVKDRVLAHNPLGAVYTSQGYYKRLRKKP
jgi:uncharacterized metal-binding protein